ncbi:neurofilament heavy polypeptide-like isoform X1 [Montipora capricornis]|uniref:neurofilament heavy polypeptide-like isoform X1 n=1 Tax=Montipora capricornis TaxID=246305 RepID=UPI0035F18B0F
MYKNPQREGTYQDCQWQIQIKDENKKGQRKVIATGSFDLDNYITSDEEHSFEITVTLISSNKNILTGSIEFQLTSVMLEDGVPYRSKEEELKEYLREAMKSSSYVKNVSKQNKVGRGKASPESSKLGSSEEISRPQKNNLQGAGAIKPTVTNSSTNSGKNVARQSESHERRACAPASRPLEHRAQPHERKRAAYETRNNGGPKKPQRKRAPPPPIPPRPERLAPRNLSQVAPVPGNKKKNSVEMKNSPAQRGEEQQPKCSDTSPCPIRRKGKRKPKNNYPDELNPFAESSPVEEQLKKASSEDVSNGEETPLPDTARADVKEDALPHKHKRKTRRGGRKNRKKYPKELNPFERSSVEDLPSLSPEEAVDKEPSLEDASVTVKKGKSLLPKNKETQKNDYPKMLNPFCDSASSDDEEVSSCKTSYMENACSASSKLDSKERSLCLEVSSVGPQCNKEQEPNIAKGIKPNGVNTCKSEKTRKEEDNIKDENAELKEAKRSDEEETKVQESNAENGIEPCDTDLCKCEETWKKEDNMKDENAAVKEAKTSDEEETDTKDVTDYSSQMKPEGAGHLLGAEAVDATVKGRLVVDKRPVRSETVSLEHEKVMANPEEQTLKADAKQTSFDKDLCCEKTEFVVNSGEGTSGASAESQDIEGEQQPISHLDKAASLMRKLPPKPPRQNVRRKRAAITSSKLFKSRLEISAYVAEEKFTLDQEIDSLGNVIFTVEKELHDAMKFAECQEECIGLKQDWLSLNKYLDQLNARKQNLEILELSDNLEQIVDMLKAELRLLFEMEDWRKCDRQKAQEANLLSLVLSLDTKRRVNY